MVDGILAGAVLLGLALNAAGLVAGWPRGGLRTGVLRGPSAPRYLHRG